MPLLASAAAKMTLSSRATATFRYAGELTDTVLYSNESIERIAPTTVSIRFFQNAGFSNTENATGAGRQLFVQVDTEMCNRDPNAVETTHVTLQSLKTGDWSSLTLTETGPDTGVFRNDDAWVGVAGSAQRMADDVITVQPDDRIAASMDDCGVQTQNWILIDPRGMVFDSATGQPVGGARVTLIDVTGAGNGGHAGGAAVVFSYDGVTPAPSEVVTGADGRYVFPLVPPSSYRLNVVVAGWAFPSTRVRTQLPVGLDIGDPGSFGGNFPVNASTGLVILDLPVDTGARPLRVQKAASRSTAEVAETVSYSVSITNTGATVLDAVSLQDSLPLGFSLVPGSALLDGVPLADPAAAGSQLAFPLGAMAAAQEKKLQYRLRIGTRALQGDGINRAQASSSAPVITLSNVASARVKVLAGVFTEQTMLLGTAFADCNRDGEKQADEPGVPGLRLVLEDGTTVTTDGEGRYSLYGISPKAHVLHVDRTSLPIGASLMPLSHRHTDDGASVLVDPKKSELHRADFAIAGCSETLLPQLQTRRAALSADPELKTAAGTELRAQAAGGPGDVRALPAQGLIAPLVVAQFPAAPIPAKGPAKSPLPIAAGTALSARESADLQASLPLADLLTPETTPELDFIGLDKNQQMPQHPRAVRIKGRAGTNTQLWIDGVAVPADRIGLRVRAEGSAVELTEFAGLTLPVGNVLLELTERDNFGILRANRRVHVNVAGGLAQLRVQVPDGPVPADGSTVLPISLQLVDARGYVVDARQLVTLTTTLGEWEADDMDVREPGTQVFIEGGVARIGLRVPAAAGDADIRVMAVGVAGDIGAQARIRFVPALRPIVAAGLVEGVLNLRKLDAGRIASAGSNDGFEQEIHQFAEGSNASAGARAALYLKGKVRGDYLLTLGYDSDKGPEQTLFRDIQPDAFYPVYGDSSVKGFDAQSTGRLYVRIDKNKSTFLYGDFTTQGIDTVRQLGAYQRSLNGVKQHYEDERVSANVFASREESHQAVIELRGNGTSGPYELGTGNAVENSERVEILVRDRNQNAVVLSTTPMQRLRDYDFEPFSGRLLFRAPVASVDANLNPVSIRVTYEVEQSGTRAWVAGGDAKLKVTEQWAVGGAAVKDENPLAPFSLQSVNTEYKFAEQTVLSAEAAHVDNNGQAGGAQRAELVHEGAALKVRAHAARTDADFVNPSSTLTAGRREAGAKGSYALDEKTRVVADLLLSDSATDDSTRRGALVGIERSLGTSTKLETGVRVVEASSPTAPDAQTRSVRAKLGTAVPGLPMATVYGEAEQDVTDADKRLVAIGGDYQIANRGRIYMRHELISSLNGPYALDATQRHSTTLFGVEGEYMRDGRLFSEYRGRDAFDGRQAEAAIGLRNQWKLAEGLRLNTTFERVSALGAPNAGSPAVGESGDSTAVTGAIEYTANPLMKATGRLEVRRGQSSDSLLSTLGLARKISDDWTALVRNLYASTDNHGVTANRLQERFQIGAAYRDSSRNRLNGLARYEFKREAGQGDGLTRNAHIVSAHVNQQPMRGLTLAGLYAAKQVTESGVANNIKEDVQSRAQLVTGRATKDLFERWDLGLALRLLSDGSGGSRQTGAGAEVGYRVQDRLWVAAGYNVTGVRDRDLANDSETRRGVYLRMRMSFDENSLGAL